MSKEGKGIQCFKRAKDFRCWNPRIPLKDRSPAVSSFRHLQENKLVILCGETRNFEVRGPEGGIKAPSR